MYSFLVDAVHRIHQAPMDKRALVRGGDGVEGGGRRRGGGRQRRAGLHQQQRWQRADGGRVRGDQEGQPGARAPDTRVETQRAHCG